jgi:hypothetical protein
MGARGGPAMHGRLARFPCASATPWPPIRFTAFMVSVQMLERLIAGKSQQDGWTTRPDDGQVVSRGVPL